MASALKHRLKTFHISYYPPDQIQVTSKIPFQKQTNLTFVTATFSLLGRLDSLNNAVSEQIGLNKGDFVFDILNIMGVITVAGGIFDNAPSFGKINLI